MTTTGLGLNTTMLTLASIGSAATANAIPSFIRSPLATMGMPGLDVRDPRENIQYRVDAAFEHGLLTGNPHELARQVSVGETAICYAVNSTDNDTQSEQNSLPQKKSPETRAQSERALMPFIAPSEYAGENNWSAFEIGDTVINISYAVEPIKKKYVFTVGYKTTVEVNVNDGTHVLHYSYEIPKNRKVGDELNTISQGLYGLLDEAIRTLVQFTLLERVRADVATAETECLDAVANAISNIDEQGPSGRQETGAKARLHREINDFATKLINAIVSLTHITSLSRDGFEAYQAKKSRALVRVTETGNLPARVIELHQGIVQLLEADIAAGRNVENVQERVLEYLLLLERREDLSFAITPSAAAILVDEFAKSYAQLVRQRELAALFPTNLLHHTGESIVNGGLGGWIGLDLIGESVLKAVFGLSLNIPGVAIGIGALFVLPYLSYPVRARRVNRTYEKGVQDLIRSVDRKLIAAPASEQGSLSEFAAEWRERKAKRKAEVDRYKNTLMKYLGKRKSKSENGDDIAYAVKTIKTALLETEIPVEHVEAIMQGLRRRWDDRLRDFADATAEVVSMLGSLPSYTHEDIVLTLIDTGGHMRHTDRVRDHARSVVQSLK